MHLGNQYGKVRQITYVGDEPGETRDGYSGRVEARTKKRSRIQETGWAGQDCLFGVGMTPKWLVLEWWGLGEKKMLTCSIVVSFYPSNCWHPVVTIQKQNGIILIPIIWRCRWMCWICKSSTTIPFLGLGRAATDLLSFGQFAHSPISTANSSFSDSSRVLIPKEAGWKVKCSCPK